MTIPHASTYRAWAWQQPGEPEQLLLEEQVVAPPGPGEIVVRNTIIALNPVDWKVIAQTPAGWRPGHVPGVDGVGTVSAVGEGVSVPVGARVAYHQGLGKPGSFAGYTTMDPDCALVIPGSVSDESAAGIPCPGLTAWQALAKVPDIPNRDVLECLVPGFDGALFSREWRDALWARFTTGAPPRQRQSVERYSIVKRV